MPRTFTWNQRIVAGALLALVVVYTVFLAAVSGLRSPNISAENSRFMDLMPWTLLPALGALIFVFFDKHRWGSILALGYTALYIAGFASVGWSNFLGIFGPLAAASALAAWIAWPIRTHDTPR